MSGVSIVFVYEGKYRLYVSGNNSADSVINIDVDIPNNAYTYTLNYEHSGTLYIYSYNTAKTMFVELPKDSIRVVIGKVHTYTYEWVIGDTHLNDKSVTLTPEESFDAELNVVVDDIYPFKIERTIDVVKEYNCYLSLDFGKYRLLSLGNGHGLSVICKDIEIESTDPYCLTFYHDKQVLQVYSYESQLVHEIILEDSESYEIDNYAIVGEKYLWNSGETSNAITFTPAISDTKYVNVTFSDGTIVDANYYVKVLSYKHSTLTFTKAGKYRLYSVGNGEKFSVINEDIIIPEDNYKYIITHMHECVLYVYSYATLRSVSLRAPSMAVIDVGEVHNYEYLWGNGSSTKSIVVSPEYSQYYSVQVIADGKYEYVKDIYLRVRLPDSKPKAVIIADKTSITFGDSITLDGRQSCDELGNSEIVSWTWSNGSTQKVITIYPKVSSSYSLTVIDNVGRKSKAVISITVLVKAPESASVVGDVFTADMDIVDRIEALISTMLKYRMSACLEYAYSRLKMRFNDFLNIASGETYIDAQGDIDYDRLDPEHKLDRSGVFAHSQEPSYTFDECGNIVYGSLVIEDASYDLIFDDFGKDIFSLTTRVSDILEFWCNYIFVDNYKVHALYIDNVNPHYVDGVKDSGYWVSRYTHNKSIRVPNRLVGLTDRVVVCEPEICIERYFCGEFFVDNEDPLTVYGNEESVDDWYVYANHLEPIIIINGDDRELFTIECVDLVS